jgi:pimeloyl-ACP methyl ester carboxylesterase
LGPLLARQIAVRGDDFLETAWHDPSKITSEIREGYREPLQVNHWDRALWELTKASRQLGLADDLDRIAAPSLVITGDDDRVVPTDSSVRLAQDLPNAELVVIPQCGHLPQEECPDAFLDAVERFLASEELTDPVAAARPGD